MLLVQRPSCLNPPKRRGLALHRARAAWTPGLLAALLAATLCSSGCGETAPPEASAEDAQQPSDTSPDSAGDEVLEGDSVAGDAAAPEDDVVSGPIDLVNNEAWVLATKDLDPWYEPGGKGDDELCEPETYQLEPTPDGDWFEVNTSFCGYVTFQTPLTESVPAGAELTVNIGHYPIEDGTGPYLIALGMGDPGSEVWSVEVTPPADPSLLAGTWETSRDFEAGEPVFWHVSNHGDNHWYFMHLRWSKAP